MADYLEAAKSDSAQSKAIYATGEGALQQLVAGRILRPLKPVLTPRLDFETLTNVLPNTGGLAIPLQFVSARAIVDAFTDPAHRSQEDGEFAGFAIDDAVFDEASQGWELWSNAGLAGCLARYACRRYSNPTILELGCGPAHLFFFFRSFGLTNYVGVDGNPYFVKYNSLLHGFENHFLVLNLQDRIQLTTNALPLTFDLICSFEVLEHIQEDRLDNLLWTVAQHMHSRSVFVGSASLQPDMDVHVLVRPREWWLDRFSKFGLVPVSDEAAFCREILAHQPFNWGGDRTNVFALRSGQTS